MPGGTCQQTDDSGNGEYEEEKIITFQMPFMRFMVMIPVQRPANAMHNIFMRQPGYALHPGKECGYDEKVCQPGDHGYHGLYADKLTNFRPIS